jgi:hypothetical protein
MHALAVTPAIPSITVSAPTAVATPRSAVAENHNVPAYTVATAENAENNNTSRLSHDRRHIFTAR